jgi:hypothetical protein
MEDLSETLNINYEYGRPSLVQYNIYKEIDATRILLALPPAEGIFWGMMKAAPGDARRAEKAAGPDSWTTSTDGFHYCFTYPRILLPAGKKEAPDYSPGQVINGVGRVVGDSMNMWASDPEKALPQWIELDFREDLEFNRVHLVFDNDLDRRDKGWSNVPRETAKDYTLSCFRDGEWKEILAEKGNFLRFRALSFEAVRASRLRLTVAATHGDPSARVFEIRVYNE